MANKLKDILFTDIDKLKLNLSIITNVNLLHSFKKNFEVLGDYKPATQEERWQILEFSAAYIDEFKARMDMSNADRIIELANLLQTAMKRDASNPIETYYTRNLVRLYSRCIQKMKKLAVDQKFIRRYFL